MLDISQASLGGGRRLLSAYWGGTWSVYLTSTLAWVGTAAEGAEMVMQSSQLEGGVYLADFGMKITTNSA